MVLITGSAGGLGQGLIREFVGQGWQVAAGFHRAELEVRSASVLPVRLDVTSASQVGAAVEEVQQRWGAIDVLINNAGAAADQPLWQMQVADWEQVITVNLKGAFLCSRAVLPGMLRQRNGHIINLGSFSGRVGARGQANYAAAKAGLIGLTQALAKEAGSGNVRVNTVLPGVLRTGMTAGLTAEAMRAFAAANALGRLNRIEEVARFVAFLATLENVSGQMFQLDSRIARWS